MIQSSEFRQNDILFTVDDLTHLIDILSRRHSMRFSLFYQRF